MRKIIVRPLRAALFFIAVISCFSCTKPENDLGLTLQPDEDLLSVSRSDTFSLTVYSLLDDSLRSDGVFTGLLGAYNDPVFGEVKAEMVLQMLLNGSNIDFTPPNGSLEDLVVDSMILSLAYGPSPNYGNGLGAQYFQVFELEESLYSDSLYYTTSTTSDLGVDLVQEGQNLIVPDPENSVMVGEFEEIPQLRIPLNTDLGYRIINYSGTGSLNNDAAFLEVFKGLKITTDPAQADLSSTSVLSFNYDLPQTRVTMYYRNEVTGENLSITFQVSSSSKHYNKITHDYSLADPDLVQQVINDNHQSGTNKLFVQAGGGTKLYLKIPDLSYLPDSLSSALNKAELVFPFEPETTEDFNPPSRLLVLGLNEEGRAYIIPDQTLGDAYFGGFVDKVNNEYRVNITYYLQQVMLGSREDYGLEVDAILASSSVNRIILNGNKFPDPENPERNLKLVLTFTKF